MKRNCEAHDTPSMYPRIRGTAEADRDAETLGAETVQDESGTLSTLISRFAKPSPTLQREISQPPRPTNIYRSSTRNARQRNAGMKATRMNLLDNAEHNNTTAFIACNHRAGSRGSSLLCTKKRTRNKAADTS